MKLKLRMNMIDSCACLGSLKEDEERALKIMSYQIKDIEKHTKFKLYGKLEFDKNGNRRFMSWINFTLESTEEFEINSVEEGKAVADKMWKHYTDNVIIRPGHRCLDTYFVNADGVKTEL